METLVVASKVISLFAGLVAFAEGAHRIVNWLKENKRRERLKKVSKIIF